MSWTLETEHAFGSRSMIRRFALPSGLKVIHLRQTSAPLFSYQTWFRVGSRHERPGRTGMAHYFEHLMFNRTESREQGEFDRLIERTGGDTNAATWVDWTYYRDSLPARDFELAVSLEADRMQHLLLEDEQLESEREVIINERLESVEDDVDGFLDEQLFAHAFTCHPYRWSTIGWMEDIRALAKPDVHAFYRTFYAPNNATIIVVGDVEEARVLDTIARGYGDIAAAELPSEEHVVEPEQHGERRVRFAKPVVAERAIIGFKSPGQAHPDWPVLELIAAILAGGPSSRLHRRLVIDTQMCSALDAAVMPFRDPSLFRVGVNMARGHRLEAAEAELDAAVAALAARQLDTAELDKVRSGVETDFWSAMQDVDGKAENLGHFETTLGDFAELFAQAGRLAAVTTDDVARVAATYLTPARRTVVVAEPDGEAA